MSGQVDEPTKKRRAAELLRIAADARSRWARRHVGRVADVLLESRLADDRWVGHAADHTLVAVAVATGEPRADLEGSIARVAIEGVDRDRADRAVGRIVELSRPSVLGDDAHG